MYAHRPTLLLLRHPTCYTLGLSGSPARAHSPASCPAITVVPALQLHLRSLGAGPVWMGRPLSAKCWGGEARRQQRALTLVTVLFLPSRQTSPGPSPFPFTTHGGCWVGPRFLCLSQHQTCLHSSVWTWSSRPRGAIR